MIGLRLHMQARGAPCPLGSPRNRETGQTIIVVGFGLIVMLGFAGLAIDGSNVYLQHRRMQNAADAGALAGARILATGGQTNAEVLAAIRDFALKNGGKSESLQAEYVSATNRIGTIESFGNENPPPSNAVGVYVAPSARFPVVFGGILGVSSKTASAEASASMGSTGALNRNVFPVAIDDDLLKQISPGAPFRVWDDDRITDADGNTLNSHRGWLNFNFIYSSDDPNSRTSDYNYSNSDLKDWVSGYLTKWIHAGSLGGLDGDFINGDPGVRDSTIIEARKRVGDVVYIPVYDTLYDRTFMQTNVSPTPNCGWPGGVSGSFYYHIIGFAAFDISNVSHGDSKYIEGYFVNKVIDGDISGGLTADEGMISVGLSDIPPIQSGNTTAPSAPSSGTVSAGGAGGIGG